jgi:hypothetical protein
MTRPSVTFVKFGRSIRISDSFSVTSKETLFNALVLPSSYFSPRYYVIGLQQDNFN